MSTRLTIQNGAIVSGSLDVSGSSRFTDGLTVTGSLQAQGVFSVDRDSNGSGSVMIPTNYISQSLSEVFGFPSNPKTGSMFYDEISKWLWVYTGEGSPPWRYIPLGPWIPA